MTTERTSIGRRLAVRRAAHRPPRRGRKGAHRAIVAPLATTLAATVAAGVFVGVGAALAKAGRERRSARRRRDERRLGLGSSEPLADGLRRMALGQADLAIELLDDPPALDDGAAASVNAVHETRKALKRLRALLRALSAELGEEEFARENAVLRDVGRSLAGARDAEVMLSTLDALVERHPRKLDGHGGVRRLRERLAAEHERAVSKTLTDVATRTQAIAELRAFRARVTLWRLEDRDGIELVSVGLQRLYRQGRRRGRRAARTGLEDVRAMHEWRKRVKDLRYVAEMLGRKSLARRADALGEVLGEDHDLAVLADWVRTHAKHGPRSQRVGRRTRKLLLKLIAKRRRKLRKRALSEGRRLYRRSPNKFARKLAR
jgi:CHAD domain-containing protein